MFTEWIPHQVLLAQDSLYCFRKPLFGRVIYVCHEWLSPGHPDPSGHQLKYLQATLQELLAGNVTVQMNASQTAMRAGMGLEPDSIGPDRWSAALPEMLLWFDFCCMPPLGSVGGALSHPTASDRSMAMDSIPRYIE